MHNSFSNSTAVVHCLLFTEVIKAANRETAMHWLFKSLIHQWQLTSS